MALLWLQPSRWHEWQRVGGGAVNNKLIKTHNAHQRLLGPLRYREREQRKPWIKGGMEAEEGAIGGRRCQQVLAGC